MKLNITAILTLDQVREVVDALDPDVPAIVSVFAGRIADTGRDPVPLMSEAAAICAAKPKAELLWASPRELLNIFQAEECGCHIITVTPEHPEEAVDGRQAARRALARHREDVLQRRRRGGIQAVIVTRTPFRVTLGGGGTDLPSYYSQHGGFIFAMGLDKYMYVIVNRPTVGAKLRLHYSQSEVVDHVSELRHELAREALRAHGVEHSFEVGSIADLPAGTGLGSSSCYLVGLLNALHHDRRDYVPLQALAEEACHIELDILEQPIGKQDQYMAAYGGLTVLEIAKDGTVAVRQLRPSSSDIAEFVAHTHIYYTGSQRDAREVLHDQNVAMQKKDSVDHARVADSLHRIKDLGYRILDVDRDARTTTSGASCSTSTGRTRRSSPARSRCSKVDEIYDEVRERFGVLGGKIIGAGGGGFLMLYCASHHAQLERSWSSSGMPRMHYTIEPEGTKVVAQMGPGFLSPRRRWRCRRARDARSRSGSSAAASPESRWRRISTKTSTSWRRARASAACAARSSRTASRSTPPARTSCSARTRKC